MAAGRPGPPLVLTRDRTIDALRRRLERLGDGEHSTCHVVAERGIFCRGFRRWDDHEFHRRWAPVLGQSTHLTRPQIERLADLWELCEQVGRRVRVACDARAAAPGPCRGWCEFSNEALGILCSELLGRPVSVEMGNDSFASGAPTASREIKRAQET